MTECNNNNKVLNEDRSKRRKKKKSKNNLREFFPTHEISKVNNTKAKTVNNNLNFTHQTAMNDKLVNNNKKPKEKKESNSKLMGNVQNKTN
ncbi:Hypothetical protein CINCED_3A015958 [Cinara cedri]|uniref:Uncharacterized protein n=1 Tax=Cinara cedri TaxID=506608 RepID=A0A5E4NBJ6_9HEMI|nr:Hypothetical protein CINCED_3A015958 [Cinara cedri]